MTNKRATPFHEFRALLQRLGYEEKRTETALAFHHPEEGLLLFRVYRDDEPVDARDLLTTRKFLDLRGLLDAASFDRLLMPASTPPYVATRSPVYVNTS